MKKLVLSTVFSSNSHLRVTAPWVSVVCGTGNFSSQLVGAYVTFGSSRVVFFCLNLLRLSSTLGEEIVRISKKIRSPDATQPRMETSKIQSREPFLSMGVACFTCL